MKILNDESFIKVVESSIDPAEVSSLFFFNTFKRLIPRSLFKKLLHRASKRTPYIGFVIEPCSLFLFFKLRDIGKAKSLLPERYELKKARVFAGDQPDYYFGIGAFNTRASTFWGTRLESYLIAEDKETGLLSWIFIDILSNTIIALPTEGITDPNARNAIFTTSSKADVFLDFKEDKTGRQISLKGNIRRGQMRRLDQELWVTGNTSIGHSKDLADQNNDPFAVIFDPAEVIEALDIPTEDISLAKNTLFPDLAEPEVCRVACFPFAQHYIADSPGCRTYVKNRSDMIDKYNEIADLKEIRTFSSKTIKKLFLVGTSISCLASIILTILLILGI